MSTKKLKYNVMKSFLKKNSFYFHIHTYKYRGRNLNCPSWRLFSLFRFSFLSMEQECKYTLNLGTFEISLPTKPGFWFRLVMATGLSRPGKSPGRDGTGQDLETLKVPWSCGPRTKEVQKSRDFFWRSRDSPAPFSGQDFAI